MKRWYSAGIITLAITLITAAGAGSFLERGSWWSAAFMVVLTIVFSSSVIDNFVRAGEEKARTSRRGDTAA